MAHGMSELSEVAVLWLVGWGGCDLQVHVRVDGDEEAFVLHGVAPLEAHHHRVAGQLQQEGSRVDRNELRTQTNSQWQRSAE